MNLKKLAYKSTGPILQVGGVSYMIYGFVKGDAEAIVEGFIALSGGHLINQRTKYVQENIDRLKDKISKLETKIDD